MVSDRHDMFGRDPVGGTSLVTAVPMQRSNYKTQGEKFNSGDYLKATMKDIKGEVDLAAEKLERQKIQFLLQGKYKVD